LTCNFEEAVVVADEEVVIFMNALPHKAAHVQPRAIFFFELAAE